MSKYLIKADAGERLIIGKPIGFWSDEDFAAYRCDLLTAIERAGPNCDLMIDLSEYPVQSAELVGQYNRLTEEIAEKGVSRMVMVAAPPLLSMQVRRAALAVRPHFAATEDEGRRWLREKA